MACDAIKGRKNQYSRTSPGAAISFGGFYIFSDFSIDGVGINIHMGIVICKKSIMNIRIPEMKFQVS